MTEKLFRGKRTDGKGFVYGDYIHCGISGKDFIFPQDSEVNESQLVGEEGRLELFTFEVIPETVGQFIGITDKNSEKVFEGDIIKFGNGIGVIQWATSWWGFQAKVEKNGKTHFCTASVNDRGQCFSIEVTGNIFDDSELLKE